MGTEGAWGGMGTAGVWKWHGDNKGDSMGWRGHKNEGRDDIARGQHVWGRHSTFNRDGNEHSAKTGMGTGILQARGGDIVGMGLEVGTGMIEVETSMEVKMGWERGWECHS